MIYRVRQKKKRRYQYKIWVIIDRVIFVFAISYLKRRSWNTEKSRWRSLIFAVGFRSGRRSTAVQFWFLWWRQRPVQRSDGRRRRQSRKHSCRRLGKRSRTGSMHHYRRHHPGFFVRKLSSKVKKIAPTCCQNLCKNAQKLRPFSKRLHNCAKIALRKSAAIFWSNRNRHHQRHTIVVGLRWLHITSTFRIGFTDYWTFYWIFKLVDFLFISSIIALFLSRNARIVQSAVLLS